MPDAGSISILLYYLNNTIRRKKEFVKGFWENLWFRDKCYREPLRAGAICYKIKSKKMKKDRLKKYRKKEGNRHGFSKVKGTD